MRLFAYARILIAHSSKEDILIARRLLRILFRRERERIFISSFLKKKIERKRKKKEKKKRKKRKEKGRGRETERERESKRPEKEREENGDARKGLLQPRTTVSRRVPSVASAVTDPVFRQ